MANRDNDDNLRSGRPRRAAEDDASYVPRRVSREPSEETARRGG